MRPRLTHPDSCFKHDKSVKGSGRGWAACPSFSQTCALCHEFSTRSATQPHVRFFALHSVTGSLRRSQEHYEVDDLFWAGLRPRMERMAIAGQIALVAGRPPRYRLPQMNRLDTMAMMAAWQHEVERGGGGASAQSAARPEVRQHSWRHSSHAGRKIYGASQRFKASASPLARARRHLRLIESVSPELRHAESAHCRMLWRLRRRRPGW